MTDVNAPSESSAEQFRKNVLAALHAYRRNVRGESTPAGGVELDKSPLAQEPAVRGLCWASEPTREQLTAAMKSLIEWAVERLRPWDTADPDSQAWKRYIAIHTYYIQGKTWDDVKERLTLEKYSHLQEPGLDAVIDAIAAALSNPHELDSLRRKALEDRLAALDPAVRRLLEFIATLGDEVSIDDLEEAVANVERSLGAPVEPSGAGVKALLAARLLEPGDRNNTYRVPPNDVRPGVTLGITDPALRRAYGELAARRLERRGDFLNAARSWRDGGFFQEAAALLIETYQSLFDKEQTDALLDLVGKFRRDELGDSLYTELYIAAGQVAMLAENSDQAIRRLEEVLDVDDKLLHVLVLYHLAKAYHQARSVDMAIGYFEEALAQLDALPPDEQRALYSGKVLSVAELRFDVWLGLAWVYIQGGEDLDQAVLLLARAEQALPSGDSNRKCELLNGWAGYHKKRENRAAEVDHRRKAYIVAGESGEIRKKIMTAHNLGQTLVFMGAELRKEGRRLVEEGREEEGRSLLEKGHELLAEGRKFLEISLSLADQAQDRRDKSMNLKALGAAHFFDDEYEFAIRRYVEAFQVFDEMKNKVMQAYLCHDLAEAYGALNQVAGLRHYYEAARALETTTGNAELKRLLDSLYERFEIALREPMDEAEIQLLSVAMTNGRITNREAQALLGVTADVAHDKLSEMVVVKKLLRLEGKGRGAHYVVAG